LSELLYLQFSCCYGGFSTRRQCGQIDSDYLRRVPMKIISALLLLGVLLTGAYAQRPRAMDSQPAAQAPAAKPAPGPKTVKAKYEGGIFGYTKTMEGTLTLDDDNNRLFFK